jgi:hypothetical protein
VREGKTGPLPIYVGDTHADALVSVLLGWWASTQAYRGRLIRITIQLREQDASPIIVAEEVSCVNAFDEEAKVAHRPQRWKPMAAVWHGAGRISYRCAVNPFLNCPETMQPRLNFRFPSSFVCRLPINHNSPHAGLSVDILHPILRYTPIFCLTPEQGFTLVQTDNGTISPGAPISAPFDPAQQRKLDDTSGTSEHPPSRYSLERGPCFPGRDAYNAGLLRSIDSWGGQQTSDDSASTSHGWCPNLHNETLTAPAFTLKARRINGDEDKPQKEMLPINGTSEAQQAYTDAHNMDYINQARRIAAPQRQAPILISNAGGNAMFRAFLEGIGAALPAHMHDALFDEPGDQDLQEHFYPINRCPLRGVDYPFRPISKPALVTSLQGLWAGCYSTHGYEFGIINVRNVWMRTESLGDSSIFERFYGEERMEQDNSDPSVAREPLSQGLLGSTKVLRTIIEFVKVTGDVNVPAGQVSWCAVLPRPFGDDDDSSSSTSNSDVQEEIQSVAGSVEIGDIESVELPTVKRSDWETWSDVAPHSAEEHFSLSNPPRWDEGCLEAAGRIAFTGFIDTRFIDAIATFVREDEGQVDEIRVTW